MDTKTAGVYNGFLHYYCDVAILIAKNVNIHNEKEEELYLILSLYRLCNC